MLLSAAMPCSNRQHRSRSSLAWAFQCVSGSILPPQNDAAFQSKHSTQRLLSHPKSSCLNVDFTKMSVPILLQHDLVSTFHETHPALGPGTHPARRDFSLRSATSLLRCHRKDHPQSGSTPPTPPPRSLHSSSCGCLLSLLSLLANLGRLLSQPLLCTVPHSSRCSAKSAHMRWPRAWTRCFLSWARCWQSRRPVPPASSPSSAARGRHAGTQI